MAWSVACIFFTRISQTRNTAAPLRFERDNLAKTSFAPGGFTRSDERRRQQTRGFGPVLPIFSSPQVKSNKVGLQ